MQMASDSLKKKKCTDTFLDLCIQREVTMDMILKVRFLNNHSWTMINYYNMIYHLFTKTIAIFTFFRI